MFDKIPIFKECNLKKHFPALNESQICILNTSEVGILTEELKSRFTDFMGNMTYLITYLCLLQSRC